MSRTWSIVSFTDGIPSGCTCTADEIMSLIAWRFVDTNTVNFTHDGTLLTYEANVITNKSVTASPTWIELEWDESVPAPNKYYGTDALGTKWFHLLPSWSTQSVYTYGTLGMFPVTGAINTIYIAADTARGYAWDVLTSAYLPIGGTTSSQILESTGEINGSSTFSTTPIVWDSNFDAYLATTVFNLPQYNANPSLIAKATVTILDELRIYQPNTHWMFFTDTLLTLSTPQPAPDTFTTRATSHYNQFPWYTMLSNASTLICWGSINTTWWVTVTVNSYIIVPTGASPYTITGSFNSRSIKLWYNYSI